MIAGPYLPPLAPCDVGKCKAIGVAWAFDEQSRLWRIRVCTLHALKAAELGVGVRFPKVAA